MNNNNIKNSSQLMFLAYLSMHMEDIYSKTINHSDITQRVNYLELIITIAEQPFEIALEEYLQISKADTDIKNFNDEMLRIAQERAQADFNLKSTS